MLERSAWKAGVFVPPALAHDKLPEPSVFKNSSAFPSVVGKVKVYDAAALCAGTV